MGSVSDLLSALLSGTLQTCILLGRLHRPSTHLAEGLEACFFALALLRGQCPEKVAAPDLVAIDKTVVAKALDYLRDLHCVYTALAAQLLKLFH